MAVTAVAVSADEKRILICYGKNEAYLWNIEDGVRDQERVIRAESTVMCIAWEEGELGRFAIGCSYGDILIFNKEGECLRGVKIRSCINVLVFRLNNHLLSGSSSGLVRTWDASTCVCVDVWDTTDSHVTALTSSLTGSEVVAGCSNGWVYHRSLLKKTVFAEGHDGRVVAVCQDPFSSDWASATLVEICVWTIGVGAFAIMKHTLPTCNGILQAIRRPRLLSAPTCECPFVSADEDGLVAIWYYIRGDFTSTEVSTSKIHTYNSPVTALSKYRTFLVSGHQDGSIRFNSKADLSPATVDIDELFGDIKNAAKTS